MPLRVFLIDDNPQDRRLVTHELQRGFADVQIVHAIDADEFAARIREGGFDVVVTDYHLGWSDGILVLKTVKAEYPNCPVIMFTATGSEEIAVEAMKIGLDDYVIKSVRHLMRLRSAVASALQTAETRKKLGELSSRMDSVLSQLKLGVFSCTKDGQLLQSNDAMRQLLETELVPRNKEPSVKLFFPDDFLAENFLRDVLASQGRYTTELDVLNRAGAMRTFRLNVNLVTLPGEEVRIDGLIEDVTEQKKADLLAKDAAVAAAKIDMLSPREREVLTEVVAGRPNKMIAVQLEISEKTVEKHRSNLMTKLQVRNVAELVRLAMRASRSTSLHP